MVLELSFDVLRIPASTAHDTLLASDGCSPRCFAADVMREDVRHSSFALRRGDFSSRGLVIFVFLRICFIFVGASLGA